jgi:molybdenum cofactor biosynthesis protein B
MPVSFAIIVVSDTVYEGGMEDVSGEKARKIILGSGHKVYGKIVVPNDPKLILKAVRESAGFADALLLIGGTGPSPRDVTIDVVERIAWRRLPGFGEIFRYESYKEVGYKAITSRAELYILYDGVPVAVLPGSPNAVEVGLRILLPIIDHLVEETMRYEGRGHHNTGGERGEKA